MVQIITLFSHQKSYHKWYVIQFATSSYDVMFKHGLFEWEDVIGHQEFVTLQELISDVKAGVDK